MNVALVEAWSLVLVMEERGLAAGRRESEDTN